ncbi:hypothetical protein P691DRAFT_686600, partial [Macrolepiota fuliginosa MF-IS2]
LNNAPSMSRYSTEAMRPSHHTSLILLVRWCTASVVVLHGLPPYRSFFSSIQEISSVTIEVSTLPSVHSSAIGLYALGVSYDGFPGFLSTTMVNTFQPSY